MANEDLRDKYKKTSIAMGYEPEPAHQVKYDPKSNNTQSDVDKVNTAYNRQAEKEAQKINIGEGSMFTGNPYFDFGLAMGRKRAKVKAKKGK